MPFDRLIRFVDEGNSVVYGNLEKALPSHQIIGQNVQVLSGTLKDGFTKTSASAKVVRLLNPLENTPSVLCVGLNYHLHVKETNVSAPGLIDAPLTRQSFIPEQPVVFMTPAERLCGPLDDIQVHHRAQPMLDYEGELAFIVAKDAKDVKEEDALDYIMGYTVANDVSARNLVTMEVAFNQMGHSKSFDTFGPIGPCIASPSVVGDPHQLQLVTKVNGEVRQDTSTSDMVWKVSQLLAWLTENRSIKAATVVMTGTPSGVGWHSGGLLEDGDIVEVSVDGIGSIKNRVKFI